MEYGKKNPGLGLNTVIMGTGGTQPKAIILDVDSRELSPLLDVEQGHSVYAIEVDCETNLIAIGTRGGAIKVMSDSQNAETSDRKSRTLIQGAPVLSVCWVEKEILAASDNVGRCLLWNTEQGILLGDLEVTEGSICSVTRKDKELLAGLSSTGTLHLWRIPDRTLLRLIKGPCPPPIKGLVEMVHWPGNSSLAWPGQGGRLALFQYEIDQLTELDAHLGDFYAVSVQGDNLITTGMEDGRLRIWAPTHSESIREHNIGRGIISTAVVQTEHCFFFTVDEEGIGRLHTITKDRMDCISQVPGSDYRTVKSYPWELMQASNNQQRSAEVEKIISKIRDSTDREEKAVIEALHSRLVTLGYPHVSMAIRADNATQKNDLVEGIRWRYQLMELIPEKAGACPAMEKYAAILEKTWHMAKADAVCKRIRSIDPDYSFTLDTSNIESLAKTIDKDSCIINADIPIDQIIRSATIIKEYFCGRYLIKELPAERSRIKLDPEAIQNKYESIRKENGNQKLPPAAIEQLIEVSGKRIQKDEYVTLGDGKNNHVKGLQLVMQILWGDLGSVVRSMILFDWRPLSTDEPLEMSNKLAENALYSITNDAASNTYLSAVYRAAKYAIRRVLTQRTQEEVTFP